MANTCNRAYINIVIQFYPPRTVQLDFFKRLSDDIVWLPLRLLRCFDYRRFVNIALVFNIKLPKSVLKAKYILLLELGVLPTR